jgi:Amt family ammonium transporter
MMGPTTQILAGAAGYMWLWGYLIPLGLLLLVWGGLPPERARRVTPAAAIAIALAILGYWAVGFALHLGGAQAVNPQEPSLQGLDALLSLIPGNPGWGVVGLAGFFLSSDAAGSATVALFLTYAPLIASAVMMVTLALAHTRRWLMVVAGALTGAVIVPVAACWMWGSGWLAHLGSTLGLGYGFVDFGGSTLVLWLPGLIVLPIMLLQPREEAPGAPSLPPTYAPLLSNVGALLVGLGWLGWSLSGPFHITGAVLDWDTTAINVLLALAGAVVTGQLYAWLVSGKPEVLLAAQALTAGWGAILSCAPFLPPWGALITGLLAGLAFPIIHHALRARLRLRDAAATVALAITSGTVSLISLTLLANGRWGFGWNRVGLSEESSAPSLGIASIFIRGDTQQLSAQLVGLVSVGLWGLLWGTVIGIIASPDLLGRWPERAQRLWPRKDQLTVPAPATPEKTE